MKRCNKCEARKPLNEFHKNKNAADGLNSRCKVCAIAAAKATYERNVRARNPEIDLVRLHRAALAQARESGQRLFTPLLACPMGHKSPRFVSTQQCRQCLRERRRADGTDDARKAKKLSRLRRAAAIHGGMTHYIGAACSAGHDGKRLVSTRQCVACLADRPASRANPLSDEARRRRLAKRRRRTGRAKNRVYAREVLRHSIGHRLVRFMRTALRRVLAAAQAQKHGRMTDALGYGPEKLRARIEAQFAPGMTWENYGRWHIDHRKPIIAFVRAGSTNPALINALCNLRPMWAADNLRKGSKVR